MRHLLTDSYGRVHDYLRISVTDRCNLRCVYCMPAEGVPFTQLDKLLRADEIAFIVGSLAKMGLKRVRITGGEPLVRPDILDVVQLIRKVPGIDDIALTTNGIFLAGKAQALFDAGVNRVNVSLDSMDPNVFSKITRGGDVERVIEGIQAAARVGINPIKINVVLMKGFNDREVDHFIRMAVDSPIHVRFIEYMPIGHEGQEWRDKYLPLTFVAERAKTLGYSLVPLERPVLGNGPSQNFGIPGAKGSIGLIHPVSDHFCEACNRLRLTADGHIKACLYWEDEFNVRPYIGDEAATQALFLKALSIKPKNHEMALTLSKETLSHVPTSRRMSQIGG